MMSTLDVYVGMCEVRSGKGAQILRSTLGSCVGIGILWPQRGVCALAHCLLPESAVPSTQLSAKYVTDAIPSLLASIGATADHHSELDAVVAGGAFMMPHTRPILHGGIGESNALTAQRLLAEAGIRVIHTETGGHVGRQLSIHCDTQRFVVRSFERVI